MALQEELQSQGNVLFRYRSFIPIPILFLGLGLFAWYTYTGATFQDEHNHEIYTWICVGVSLLGQFIRAFTIGYAAPHTSGRNAASGQIAESVNKTGIYSIVRHPLYVGNFFMWLGPAMMTQNPWFIVAFILFYWVYYERIMFAEEQFLRGKFDEEYLKWAEKTPAFVPRLGGYVSPPYSFTIKKVLRQEKNGILAIFVIFYLFNIIREYLLSGELSWQGNHWLYLFVLSGLLYLVLKILKKYTKVLDTPGR